MILNEPQFLFIAYITARIISFTLFHFCISHTWFIYSYIWFIYSKWQFLREFQPGRKKVRRWNERVRAKRCDAVDWDQIRCLIKTVPCLGFLHNPDNLLSSRKTSTLGYLFFVLPALNNAKKLPKNCLKTSKIFAWTNEQTRQSNERNTIQTNGKWTNSTNKRPQTWRLNTEWLNTPILFKTRKNSASLVQNTEKYFWAALNKISRNWFNNAIEKNPENMED